MPKFWVKVTKLNYGLSKRRTVALPAYADNWKEIAKKVKQRDGYTCTKCGFKPTVKERNLLHAHHKIRKTRGGQDKLGNLVTLCLNCHAKEHRHMAKRI